MSRKKSDRPGAATPGRSEGSGACEAPSDPIIQSTTSPPTGQAIHVANFLCAGQAHAIPLRDLVALAGQDGRTVRLEIERARRNGVPILSNSKNGYWIGEDTDEIAQFVRGMEHRANQIRLTANAVREAAGID